MKDNDIQREIGRMTKNKMLERFAAQSLVEHDGELIFSKEKFAELIVRECVAICQDIDGEDNIDARSGRQDCAVEIKEHFGVEE